LAGSPGAVDGVGAIALRESGRRPGRAPVEQTVQSLKSQVRVVTALTLREIQAQNSSLNYGYAWALIEVLIYVAVLSILKLFVRALSPNDMPPFLFLILGVMPWLTFFNTVHAIETVIEKNRKLLQLPGITPLDLVLAKALQILCMYGLVFFGLAAASLYFEHTSLPRSAIGVILIYLASWMLGIALGLVLMPLGRIFPPAGKLLAGVWRFGLLVSGVYFLITTFPEWVWPYLTWNPMLHANELMRTYWFSTYQTPIGSPLYVAECLLGLAALGLSLERYVRRRIPV
jgi:capsular polysaccharide transport system permease protein